MEELARQNAELRDTVEQLTDEVQASREEAQAAVAVAPPYPAASDGAIASRRMGGVTLQLLDLSLDVLSAAGGSTATDEQLQFLQGGEHDPRKRGFTFQQAELGFRGAVDPYFTGEAYFIYFIDPEGESRFEVEEAFATTLALPFGLEEQGLQLELGQFFTAFGRRNQQHPHEWEWQDQPIILTRLFGGDGMRQTGIAGRWLTPLPWFSEVEVTVQNANGETMVSFLANDVVFEERSIGGRPFVEAGVSGMDDLAYTTRWVNAFDLTDTWNAAFGASWATGPNATGARTNILGGDVVAKWSPLDADAGFPFLQLTSEFLYRWYQADSFQDCVGLEEGDPCMPEDLVTLSDRTLRDWGFYTELLWGFKRRWSTGIRVEYAAGSGNNFGEDGSRVPRASDPFRDDRWRFSPLLMFQPSEFSRLRLQYNYDDLDHLSPGDAHSVWAGVEFLFGSHPAHRY
jgi:hypothetical protein